MIFTTQARLNEVLDEAFLAAREAASKYFQEKLGGVDRYACGFAWVNIYGIRANSKVGKWLAARGVQKCGYEKAFQAWNPSKFPCQNVDTLEAGARAFADVLKRNGFKASAGSRLD